MKKIAIIGLLSVSLLSGCAVLGKAFKTNPVEIGMTKQQVREAWGYPGDINTMTSAYGTITQWSYQFYGTYISYAYFVYFEDGRVTNIQKF